MDERIIELSLKTTRVRRRERLDFVRDRAPSSGRTTYMAHGKGYVMVRHPGCVPFVVSEKDWISWPFFWTPSTDDGTKPRSLLNQIL